MTPNDFPEEFGGHTEPFEILRLWYDEAHRTQLKEPKAFVLSTVCDDGSPRSRVLLCKEILDDGLVFYSNYESDKGHELENQSEASINFYWDPLFRQIRLNGPVKRLDRSESVKYWETRPRASQLSQWISKQSAAVDSRAQMESELKAAEEKFEGQSVPCPDHWGGYILKPQSIEFWVGRTGRFHDRHLFTMVENGWSCQRLYP